MRLAGMLLAMVLATSTAYANPLPFEIVRLLPETQQVLVYDRAHSTHVLLQPGSKFDEYVVIEVSGIEMIVEKQQQRFVVYPREAKHLALNVLPRDQNAPASPPVIYGRSAPIAAPAQVADAKTSNAKITVEAKMQVAQELALVLAQAPSRATPRVRVPALTTILEFSKLKR